jgi:sugar lactone lactonase YvrE
VGNQTGVFVYAPDGTHFGTITLPENEVASNVIFGGAEMKTLYITSRGPNVYAVDLTIAGVAAP